MTAPAITAAKRWALRWVLGWADYAAWARRTPAAALLERAHRAPAGAGVLAGLGAATVLGTDLPRWLVTAAGCVAAPSVLARLAGEAAHWAWTRDWAPLRAAVCPCCALDDDDDPDDGGPDDGPGDSNGGPGFGLTPADMDWLASCGAAPTMTEAAR